MNPSAGALNAWGWEKCATFDRNRCLYRKRYEIGPRLLRISNRKSQAADQSVSVPMTLSDLERRDARSQFFSVWSPLITFVPFYLERPFLSRWHSGVFLGQPRPHPKGKGSSVPKILGIPTYAQTVWPIGRRNLVRQHTWEAACF